MATERNRMKVMMFIYCAEEPAPDLHLQIAQLPDVQEVWAFAGNPAVGWERPDFVVITKPDNMGFYEGIEVLCPNVSIQPEVIGAEHHIITSDDIPGPLPTPKPRLRVAQPVITSADIPANCCDSAAMRPSVVQWDCSTQPELTALSGLPFCTDGYGFGIMANAGFGSGLTHMATLAD